MPLLRPAHGRGRPHLPPSERIPPLNAGPDARTAPPPAVLDLLATGEIAVHGRLRDASNATLYCTVTDGDRTATCVWKPVAGERPLWDFPDGTLAGREFAAYLVSEATGWDIVPPTVLREGPYGTGMCQLWIHEDPQAAVVDLQDGPAPEPGWRAVAQAEADDGEGGTRPVLLVHADSEQLRRVAVFDAVVNNSDRKGGHLIPAEDGHVYGIDHGICFHADDKLRTLLWGWAGEPLPEDALTVLRALRDRLGGDLGERLAEHITGAEVEATRARVARMLDTGLHPGPSGRWPAIPWPPL